MKPHWLKSVVMCISQLYCLKFPRDNIKLTNITAHNES